MKVCQESHVSVRNHAAQHPSMTSMALWASVQLCRGCAENPRFTDVDLGLLVSATIRGRTFPLTTMYDTFLSNGVIKAFIWAAIAAAIASGFVITAYSAGLYTRISGEEFPDHFAHSGVPLPNPVPDDFDVDKAKPRPYRPFRWDYYQHMGTSQLSIMHAFAYNTSIQP